MTYVNILLDHKSLCYPFFPGYYVNRMPHYDQDSINNRDNNQDIFYHKSPYITLMPIKKFGV